MLHEVVKITVQGGVVLTGHLTVPQDSKAIILFSHGSGSGRMSPRNNYVAEILQKEKFATLLVDLLTSEENQIYANRFDIDTLTDRLIMIHDWLDQNPHTETLPMGLFGASTGAAAALKAAAKTDGKILTVVSRGGRPDLAIPVLDQVKVPVLLLVGSHDQEVLKLNQKALEHLSPDSELKIIEGASHLFEEPGKLEEVGRAAKDWFLKTI